ncbi:hypothetical protein B7P43_G07253 [Cryptotermes secundus]|uniref:Uncharacterized protein n=2 Tax=Cryptotermes secundus TaxID=105785 RepID=A0A2J7RC55_9NEOP|nr:hypothetical protein B7P43_G07253 [Cryptotermes secundus]
MMNGSFDSMDKSQFNSSAEDSHSYDIYEAHNPNAAAQNFNGYASNFPAKPTSEALNPSFDLAYRNEGFRDTSTFSSSHDNWQPSATISEYNDDDNTTGPDDIHNSSTLPLDASLAMADFTFNVKQGSDYSGQAGYQPQDTSYSEPPDPPLPFDDNFHPEGEFPLLPPEPPAHFPFDYDTGRTSLLETDIDSEPIERPKSEAILETNLDEQPVPVRSKSEVMLETNLDDYAPLQGSPSFNRSKSQPLETAM